MRILSGIQPTGTLHLGNYFGAFIQWISLQNEGHECFYFIANQHAITLPQNKELLAQRTLKTAAVFLAVGIDPEKSTIFVQSDVPAHTQLQWILSCLAPIGQTERMIQFKEKSEKNPQAVNVGLLTYPILQAADILLYKTNIVPVGIDQKQHLELTRDLAKKFNTTYREIFPEPDTLHSHTTKVVGLDGKTKMSKSANNYIGLTDSPEIIWKHLSSAVTDPARVKRTDPGNPDICNIYALHKLFSPDATINTINEGCRKATIGCIECKKQLLEHIETILQPIREKYQQLMQRPDDLKEILHEGEKKANKVANETLREVYDAIGFTY